MTTEGYVPVTGVGEGYWHVEDVLAWLRGSLFPALGAGSPRPRVLVFDNASIHVDRLVIAAVVAAGYIVRFLPPYSPDYNPIELSFSALKAWIRRHWIWTRQRHRRLGDWLRWALAELPCGRFAREHFRHAAGGLTWSMASKNAFSRICAHTSAVGKRSSRYIYTCSRSSSAN